MEARAVAKHVKGGARKARYVIDQIRGKNVAEALNILALSDRAIARQVSKTLKSAIANAENTKELDVDRLVVKKAYADEGPVMKRMRPRAMGRGNIIRKKTSHITIVVDET